MRGGSCTVDATSAESFVKLIPLVSSVKPVALQVDMKDMNSGLPTSIEVTGLTLSENVLAGGSAARSSSNHVFCIEGLSSYDTNLK